MSDFPTRARTIGEKLRRCRLSRNLTQQELAGDTFSKSYISQLERGSVTPSLQALILLATRLGVSCTWLLEGSLEPASLLLKAATTCFFLGDISRMELLLKQVHDDADTFNHTDQCEYYLLRARLGAANEDWPGVLDSCRHLEERLTQSAYKSPRFVIPQNYWWGKAWLAMGNQHQAVRRWATGLSKFRAGAAPPEYEALKLMAELAELYTRLGDPEAGRVVTARMRAALLQLTALRELSRWVLARQFDQDSDPSLDGDLGDENRLTTMGDAAAWARASLTLQTANEMRQRLNT